jgi:hypothetical protein
MCLNHAGGLLGNLTGLSSRVYNASAFELILEIPVGEARHARALIERWKNILAQDVRALTNELQTAGLPRINIAQ